MITTLLWKEYREQRTTWLIMAVLAAGAIVGVAGIMQPAGMDLPERSWKSIVIAVVALIIVAMYAVVCAALLLVGEREGGTAVFLSSLTRHKTSLWRTKAVTGAVLSAAQGLVTAAVLIGAGFHLGHGNIPLGLYRLALVGIVAFTALQAFAWGMLSSAVCRTSLGAIGTAAVPIVLVWGLFLYIAGVSERGIIVCVALQAVPAAVALYSSWWLYAREDALRAESGIRAPRWFPLLWWIVRRGRVTIAFLGVLAVGVGCVLVPYGPQVWPVFTTVVGLACGLAMLAPEQAGEGHRFPGQQRLGLGWVWLTKLIVWLLIGVCAGVLGLLVAGVNVQFRSGSYQAGVLNVEHGLMQQLDSIVTIVMRERDSFGFHYLVSVESLFLFPLYAFSAAVMSTLLTRRRLTNAVVAACFTMCLLAFWIPSWFAGGQAWWQLYAVPVLLLAWSSLLLPAWIERRLFRGRGLTGLIACLASVVIWTGGILWYRVVQVPNVGQPLDVQAYLAAAPSPEQNKGGRLVEAIYRELPPCQKEVRKQLGPLMQAPFPQVDLAETDSGLRGIVEFDDLTRESGYSYLWQADEVLRKGWPAHAGKLGEWLQRLSAGAWARHALEAAPLPIGVVDLPHQPVGYVDYSIPEIYMDAETILGARALQLQAAGDDSAALDCIAAGLVISRTLCNRAESNQVRYSRPLESVALRALHTWSGKPGISRAHLARALNELRRHAADFPPATEALKADYIAELHRLDDPKEAFSFQFTEWYGRMTTGLAIFTMKTPWEAARFRRLLGLYYEVAVTAEKGGHQAFARLQKFELPMPMRWMPTWYVNEVEDRSLLARMEIVLAILLHRADHHDQLPTRLAELVPSLLPAVPLDPMTEQPFRYRVSTPGEKVTQIRRHWQRSTLVEEPVKVGVPGGIGLLEWFSRDGKETWLVPGGKE